MKLLFDTDVLVDLEDAGPAREQLSGLVRDCRRHGISIFVHEASRDDIPAEVDDARREAILARIGEFPRLKGVSVLPKPDLEDAYGTCPGPGDEIDAMLLHAAAINAVDYVVSGDADLHRRAEGAGLEARVFTVDDILAWIARTYERTPVVLPSVVDALAYELNFGDAIFDELRADYHPGFDEWCGKISREHRECWVVRSADRLAGLVIRKDEDHAQAGTVHRGPRILKISTFKVAPEFRGRKLGEQLLKQILWFAQINDYDLVYLTAYPKQRSLRMLLEAYGFVVSKVSPDGEMFLEKAVVKGEHARRPGETALEATCRGYPRFLHDGQVGKYVVPIRPEYHAMLFPEFARVDGTISNAETGKPGNTIEKVYLCHSSTRTMSPGDVLFFYMSKASVRGSQSLTTIGVVKSVRWSADLAEVKLWTAKRSVYPDAELAEMVAARPSPLMIIDFLLIGHASAAIPLAALNDAGILTGWPQSIVRLTEPAFLSLKPMLDVGYDI